MDDFQGLASEAYQKDFKNKMDRFEREAIIKTLRGCKHDINEASKWLGYTPERLRERMQELKIFFTEVKDVGRKQEKVYAKQMFWFNKYDRAKLDDLVITWQEGCSRQHDNCTTCPKRQEICKDITDKLINKIYDKTGK